VRNINMTDGHPLVFGMFDGARTRRMGAIGLGVLRYGMVALLLLWGTFKFAAFEAEAIRPLIENSPLLSWLYPLLGVRGTSSLIGVIELAAAALICTRRWKPSWSAIGSLLAAGTFVVTLSFLITTPGALSVTSPFGGFLLKDLILLGAALYTAAEALAAAGATTVPSASARSLIPTSAV
jgi:reactive chlorine resistance protein C